MHWIQQLCDRNTPPCSQISRRSQKCSRAHGPLSSPLVCRQSCLAGIASGTLQTACSCLCLTATALLPPACWPRQGCLHHMPASQTPPQIHAVLQVKHASTDSRQRSRMQHEWQAEGFPGEIKIGRHCSRQLSNPASAQTEPIGCHGDRELVPAGLHLCLCRLRGMLVTACLLALAGVLLLTWVFQCQESGRAWTPFETPHEQPQHASNLKLTEAGCIMAQGASCAIYQVLLLYACCKHAHLQ